MSHFHQADVSCVIFFPQKGSEELSEETSEHLLLEPGDVLKLRCDTNRPGAVHWFKGDVRLQHSARMQIRAGVIEITDVTYEDSGVYVCMLRGTREALRNFTITVAGMIGHIMTQSLSSDTDLGSRGVITPVNC